MDEFVLCLCPEMTAEPFTSMLRVCTLQKPSKMIRKTSILAGWRNTLQQSSTVQRGAGSWVQKAEETCTLKIFLYEKNSLDTFLGKLWN